MCVYQLNLYFKFNIVRYTFGICILQDLLLVVAYIKLISFMVTSTDPRRQEGAQVHSKALLEKNLAQCRRWFGTAKAENGVFEA